MVYCGKPSKSCRQCRNRNIKCDKKRDSCGQCIRAGLPCPGYHDPNKIIFRDQTKNTIEKAAIHTPLHIYPRVQSPVVDIAKDLFISSQVFGASGVRPTLSYMRLFPHGLHDEHLTTSVRAASLAYLYHQRPCPSTLQAARRSYSAALRQTQKALYDPAAAPENTTLLTVLLLDLFEYLTTDVDSEMRHLNGAIALLKLRGEGQFRNPLGVCMFIHLNTSVMTSCLKRGVEIPDEYIEMMDIFGRTTRRDDLEWQSAKLIVRFAALRTRLNSDEVDSHATWKSLVELDEEFQPLLVSLGAFPKTPLEDRRDAKGHNLFLLARDLLADTIQQYHTSTLQTTGTLQFDDSISSSASTSWPSGQLNL